MFLGVQLVVMALLSREGYQKRVSYFFRIFRKPDSTTGHAVGARNHTDVYANLSLLRPPVNKEDMPYCPKESPLIGEFSSVLSSFWSLYCDCIISVLVVINSLGASSQYNWDFF